MGMSLQMLMPLHSMTKYEVFRSQLQLNPDADMHCSLSVMSLTAI